jgi:hypothetical protein
MKECLHPFVLCLTDTGSIHQPLPSNSPNRIYRKALDPIPHCKQKLRDPLESVDYISLSMEELETPRYDEQSHCCRVRRNGLKRRHNGWTVDFGSISVQLILIPVSENGVRDDSETQLKTPPPPLVATSQHSTRYVGSRIEGRIH